MNIKQINPKSYSKNTHQERQYKRKWFRKNGSDLEGLSLLSQLILSQSRSLLRRRHGGGYRWGHYGWGTCGSDSNSINFSTGQIETVTSWKNVENIEGFKGRFSEHFMRCPGILGWIIERDMMRHLSVMLVGIRVKTELYWNNLGEDKWIWEWVKNKDVWTDQTGGLLAGHQAY